MSKCSKERPSSDRHAIKFGMREYNNDNQCPMRTNVLKQRPQEVTDPIPESILEEVSDDLVLLRCQLCELNQTILAKFIPEPWFNKQVILERLMEVRRSILKTIQMDLSRSDLVDLALVLDLVDRIEDTINDEEETTNGVCEPELQD